MPKWIVTDEEGNVVGYSEGETHEEAFFNFENGSLLLSDEMFYFTKVESDEDA